jgi:AcrR family transcriptional regulator
MVRSVSTVGHPVMDKAKGEAKVQLDRSAWIDAAIELLAEDGLDGIRIEVLAKRLNVTKGSFYWHFKDRQDLLDAVLDTWKQGRIRDILKQTRAEPGGEQDRLYHVLDVYSASRNRKGIRIELALRDWARRDPSAAVVVQEVDAVRFDTARRLFLARGLSREEASSRCMLLYAYVFGQSLLNCERFDVDPASLKSRIAALIAG